VPILYYKPDTLGVPDIEEPTGVVVNDDLIFDSSNESIINSYFTRLRLRFGRPP